MKENQDAAPCLPPEEQAVTDAPEIDLDATRAAFLASGRLYRPYARVKGLNTDTFALFMNGRQPPVRGGKVFSRFVEVLKEDGLLVLKSRNDDCDHAA